MIFLTVIAALPLIQNIIKLESDKDFVIADEVTLLAEHSKALMAFMFLFFGATAAFTFWYIALPSDVASSLYGIQTQTINSLNLQVTGELAVENSTQILTEVTGEFTSFVTTSTVLSRIFLNNLKVLIFCIIFSFIYGSGAIFILMWNASVIGVALGNFIRVNIAQYASTFHLQKVASYFFVVSLGVVRYALHGVPEILSYFVAGLSGGLISIAVVTHDIGTKNFYRVLLDSSDLLLISVAVLFIAALLEVFVTPIFFMTL